MSLDLKTALAKWRREEPLPFAPEAMAWIFTCVRQVAAQATQGGASDVAADSLLHYVRLRAQNQFGALAEAVLKHWRLETGEDLAAILTALAHTGAVKWSNETELASYRSIGLLLPRSQEKTSDSQSSDDRNESGA